MTLIAISDWLQNDIWQAPTWASIEYSGRWKLLHYFMKNVYKPVIVSPYLLNGKIEIYVVVDQINTSISYSLEVKVIGWEKVSIMQLSLCVSTRIRTCAHTHTHTHTHTRTHTHTHTQGSVISVYTTDGLHSSGFTGVQVWSKSVAAIFVNTTTNHSFLYMRIVDAKNEL